MKAKTKLPGSASLKSSKITRFSHLKVMKLSYSFVLGLILNSPIAHAQTAPSEGPSDMETTEINDIFSKGEIQLTKRVLEGQAGVYSIEGGPAGAQVGINLERRFGLYVDHDQYGNDKGERTNLPIQFGVKAQAKLDDQGNLAVLKTESPAIGVFGSTDQYYERKYTSDGEFRELSSKPHSTTRLEIIEAQHVYERNEIIGTRMNGAEVTPIAFDFHVARKAGALPVELCGSIQVLQLLIGSAEIREGSNPIALTPVDLKACGAIQMGQVRLKNETRYQSRFAIDEPSETRNARTHSLSNDTQLEFVSNRSSRRFGLGYTYEKESAESFGRNGLAESSSKGEVKSHSISARVAF